MCCLPTWLAGTSEFRNAVLTLVQFGILPIGFSKGVLPQDDRSPEWRHLPSRTAIILILVHGGSNGDQLDSPCKPIALSCHRHVCPRPQSLIVGGVGHHIPRCVMIAKPASSVSSGLTCLPVTERRRGLPDKRF